MIANSEMKVDRLQFRSKSIIAYKSSLNSLQGYSTHSGTSRIDFARSSAFNDNASKLISREKYTGVMTAGARKRIQKSVSLLIQSSPRKFIYNPVIKRNVYHHLSFVTLTLPDVEKSKDAPFCHKNLLQPMLRILRNKYGMKSYVWKCELQRNGSVHYHITTELFIVHTSLRNEWNNITRRHGMLDDFEKRHGHDNPNSTDIHSVDNIRDLEAYLLKYISKETQNEVSLKAKVWDCSKNLKEAKYFVTDLQSDVHESILKEIDSGQCKVVATDFCFILKFSTTDYYLSFPQHVIDQYYSHLNHISSWTNQVSSPTHKEPNSLVNKSSTLERTKKVYPLCPDTKPIPTSIVQSSMFQMTSYGMFYSTN